MVYETEPAGAAVGKEAVLWLLEWLILKLKVKKQVFDCLFNSPVRQIRGHREERKMIIKQTRTEASAMLQHGRAFRS